MRRLERNVTFESNRHDTIEKQSIHLIKVCTLLCGSPWGGGSLSVALRPWVQVPGGKFEVSNVKVTGNENMEIVFPAYLRQQWVDLHQTNRRPIVGLHSHLAHGQGETVCIARSVVCLFIAHDQQKVAGISYHT